MSFGISLKSSFPESLRECRPMQALMRALDKGRLAHALLLHGDNLEAIEEVAYVLAGALLGNTENAAVHPDFFALRPSNKMRQIGIGDTRRLIRRIQHSPYQADRKVAVVFEVDRMNNSSANAFLKTLEEPPADTTILLLSTRPYDLLDTIRSRCFHFRLPAYLDRMPQEEWRVWLDDYRAWLGRLYGGAGLKDQRADLVMSVFGLITRFQALLNQFGEDAWEIEKAKLPEDLNEEEIEALEAGVRKGIRHRLFAEIEMDTGLFARQAGGDGSSYPSRQLIRAVTGLEHVNRLLALNLKETVALEHFLLGSLRAWAVRD